MDIDSGVVGKQVPADSGMDESKEAQALQTDTNMGGRCSRSTTSNSKGDNTECRTGLLDRIAQSDAHFKHQQMEEPDLTRAQKLQIATDVLDSKPSVFLTRFGKYLEAEDLEFFTPMSGDYIIGFQIEEIKKRLNVHSNQMIVRNRRYEAMKQLEKEGEYFDDEALKERDPLLYEQMIGQYLDEKDIADKIDKADLRFSTILVKHMQIVRNNELYEKQKETEAAQMMEQDSDDEDDVKESEEESELESDEDEEPKKPSISAEEKQMLQEEFLKMMQVRFLNGEDQDFDYTKVDANEEYDSLDIRERDEQERYFDDEEPEIIDSMDTDLSDMRQFPGIPGPVVHKKKAANEVSEKPHNSDKKPQKSSAETNLSQQQEMDSESCASNSQESR